MEMLLMNDVGHSWLTKEAVGRLSLPGYLSWLSGSLPGSAVHADVALSGDIHAHFMRSPEEADRLAYEKCVNWIRRNSAYATLRLFDYRNQHKIAASKPNQWNADGLAKARDSRNFKLLTTGANLNSRGTTISTGDMLKLAGNSQLWGFASDGKSFSDVAHLDQVSEHNNANGVIHALGYALHALEDSYTARHAERTEMYSGYVVKIYDYFIGRDLLANFPLEGHAANGSRWMTHNDSDIISNWNGKQKEIALEACKALICFVIKTADSAGSKGEVYSGFRKGWDAFSGRYLKADKRLSSTIPRDILTLQKAINKAMWTSAGRTALREASEVVAHSSKYLAGTSIEQRIQGPRWSN
jgi:hypothetical protein